MPCCVRRGKPCAERLCAHSEKCRRPDEGGGRRVAEAGRVAGEEEAEAGRKMRQEITSGLDASLCARYDRIFGNRGALAVVEVKDETCQGCHMRIPPHMCNQVQSSQMQGKSEIFNCPHPYCGRIVYVQLESVEASEV